MTTAINITVPATTANLGAGFDCIGAALTLHNQFKFTPSDDFKISVTGVEAQKVSTDESNLAYQSFVNFYEHRGEKTPAVHIEIGLDVPLARGLGSSATAIVGGLMGANHLAGLPLSQDEIMNLAIALEGHPDNVVPALLGGCRLAAGGDNSWAICDVPWHESIVPVVAIPDFELSTTEARRVLPTHVSRADAIFNTAHLGLLIRALQTGRADWLKVALQDRLHQPYRQGLIHGFETVQKAAMDAGALGLVISGAGPTLLAVVDKMQASSVESAIASAWQSAGVMVDVRSLSLDSQGTKADVV
ncbi:MAG: homoserine kinase [Chroococcus sp. CMT-3BRIN-NPC107]|jgi:homoserine kinase|nr:homoserine kinase [Chroococcus sp. CMT-3BRIN-NPC107]